MSISTGIEHLNTLLGGPGFRNGSTILIRGEAGTGKTTLALQIALNILNKSGLPVVFASIEERPEIALNQITQSLWSRDHQELLGTQNQDRWKSVGLEDLLQGWDKVIDDWEEVLGNALLKGQIGFKSLDEVDQLPKAHKRELFTQIQEQLQNYPLDNLLAELWQKLVPAPASDNSLIVIDSLNALVYGAQQHFRRYDDRKMLIAILRSFELWSRSFDSKPTVIFTAEDAVRTRSKAAESYIADVVIHLGHDSKRYKIPLAPGKVSEWEEERLFCRVSKGRGLPIQRRSCCYEFVPGAYEEGGGIQFFPTYAAQGLVSLFHENQPQLEVIENLRDVDIPMSYPGVVVQEFTRSALQRMFAVRRYAKAIPPRLPMLLSHLDEYWVDVLRRAHLLYPIPRSALQLFSLPATDDPEPFIDELAKAKKKFYLDEDEKNYLAVPQMGNVSMLVYRKDLLKRIGVTDPPETWEELESISQKLRSKGYPHHLLIETQTYDTLTITALEMGWGHGFFWRTKPDAKRGLQIEFTEGSKFDDFVFAMKRLHRWIHRDKLIPLQSTVDPVGHANMNWAFARHWYSTWVDVLTRKSTNGDPVVQPKKGAEFGVAQIPVSEAYRQRQKQCGTHPIRHHSGAGEWYLALQRSSENVELGIDLINNLMTSRRVTERALFGAELPILKKVYANYGSTMCFGTDKTFDEVRALFAKGARSRTEFQEYRRVARVLFGTLQTIVTNPRAKVRRLLETAFRELDSGFDAKSA